MSETSRSPSSATSHSSSAPSPPSTSTSSPSPRVHIRIPSSILPVPTIPRAKSNKKSHARKQPVGHIPRPRNAFILFRCDYSQQNPHKTKDCDQNSVSRVVGKLWRNMTDEQRRPWIQLAAAEKKKHEYEYPSYKYMPRNRKVAHFTEAAVVKQIMHEAKRMVKAEVDAERPSLTQDDIVDIFYPPWASKHPAPTRRTTSSPPPDAVRIELYTPELEEEMRRASEPERPWEIVADRIASSTILPVYPSAGTSGWGGEQLSIEEYRQINHWPPLLKMAEDEYAPSTKTATDNAPGMSSFPEDFLSEYQSVLRASRDSSLRTTYKFDYGERSGVW